MANEVVKKRRCRITYRVPGFQNFGARMHELERESFRRMMTDSGLPAKLGGAVSAASNMLNSTVENAASTIDKNRAKNPAMANMLDSAMGGMLKLLSASLTGAERLLPNPDDAGFDPLDAPSAPARDPQLLDIHLDDGQKWSDDVQAQVDTFLGNWSNLRPKVLQAVFEAYRDAYDDIWAFAGGEDYHKITLPDPTGPEVIEDLFLIDGVHLRVNSDIIGLTGNCTWEDEHGIGVLVEKGKVLEVGHADVAYQ